MEINKFFDRLYLIITAIVVALLLLGFFMISNKIGIEEGWDTFIVCCVGYYAIVIFLVNSDINLKKYLKKGSYLIGLILSISLIELIVFLLFYHGILPLPKTVFPYIIGNFILSMVNVALFEYITKLMRKGEEEDKQS